MATRMPRRIFKQWDDDGNGNIDQREFRLAVRSLGFADVSDSDLDVVFAEFDEE